MKKCRFFKLNDASDASTGYRLPARAREGETQNGVTCVMTDLTSTLICDGQFHRPQPPLQKTFQNEKNITPEPVGGGVEVLARNAMTARAPIRTFFLRAEILGAKKSA